MSKRKANSGKSVYEKLKNDYNRLNLDFQKIQFENGKLKDCITKLEKELESKDSNLLVQQLKYIKLEKTIESLKKEIDELKINGKKLDKAKNKKNVKEIIPTLSKSKITHFQINDITYYGHMPWTTMLSYLIKEFKDKRRQRINNYFKIIKHREYFENENNNKKKYQYFPEYDFYACIKKNTAQQAFNILKKVCKDKMFRLDIEIELSSGEMFNYRLN